MGTSQGVVWKEQKDTAGACRPSYVLRSTKSCPIPLLDNMEDFPGPDALMISFTFLKREDSVC